MQTICILYLYNNVNNKEKGFVMKYLHFLNSTKNNNIGGENSDTKGIIANTSSVGINIPNGFATNDKAYLDFLQANSLRYKIEDILSNSDLKSNQTLNHAGKEVRELIFDTPLPRDIQNELNMAHDEILLYYNSDEFDTAIHSSTQHVKVPDIDLQNIENSYKDIGGTELLYKKIQERYASLFTNRAIHYRDFRGYDHFSFSPCLSILLKEKTINEKYLKLAVA